MTKKKTIKRVKLPAVTVQQQIGSALFTQNLTLFRDLIACNGSIRDLQKVWKLVGSAFDQLIGSEEFYDLDAAAYGPAEDECGQEHHTEVPEAIVHFREASYRLLHDIDIFLRIADNRIPVILRAHLMTTARRWHDFVDASLGYQI